jgi:hypothetical protein
MHDPNFERTVQQKMEELQFHPADSVWVNIEKAVAGQRRHRGLPFFWRFALPVFLAAVTTGVYYFSVRRIDRAGDRPATDKVVGAPAISDGSASSASRATTAAIGSREASLKASMATATAGSRATGPLTVSGRNAGNNRAKAIDPSRFAATSGTVASSRFGKARRTGSGSSLTGGREEKGQGQESLNQMSRPAMSQPAMSQAETGETVLIVIEPHGSRKAWFYQPELANQRQTQAIKAAKLNNKATIAIAKLQRKSRPWEAGFVAGGGLSRLNRLNAAQAAGALSYTAASFYRISGSSSGNAYISDVRSDASFSGGVYLQKAIASRWTFNTGMQLHYYSSRITIGQQVNSYVQASASFVNPAALATVPSAAVYSAGDHEVYTNRYYFLELPLNMQWRVNQSHLLPLFLEGGFSVARLMSANALLYDSQTGVYSKQGNDINKTQLYVSTAFMAGLPIHGLHVQVGPQVQYGLTPIVDGHSLGDQHFFYAGIRLVVIPGKK